ncbi:uncharacterized protein N7496_005985 [Penicillium cataractarum]|uniref:Zn(2)-C6 fungal-type domain-containing protein n=1 Tax=Penicillium cataractarum TaxID=2100454 RepID=A0A9W9V5Q2_9EURO|nr:uncharacterized protein N7496_005985 [Penicillium cataractarum]KAJ5369893.1 hypothetical protein N7496_005985 [Penicillium cataractarum]
MEATMDSNLDPSICSADDTATMTPRVPLRRPRIRKSRGRGLRTTKGCITCRKRHLKCDEVKPICGPCARKDKLCDYATPASRSVNPPAPDKENTEAVAATGTPQPVLAAEEEPHIPRGSGPGPVTDEHTEPIDVSWPTSGAISTLPNTDLLDHSSANDLVSNHSPVAYQHSYLSPSNASFAAVQWFGLLASDAARDSPHLANHPHFRSTQILTFDHSGAEGSEEPSSLQRATQVLDSPHASNATYGSADVSSTLDEEKIWQSPKAIELLPAEQTLFEHFVHQVCPWIDLFDTTTQFSTFVAHLAIHNAGLMNAILGLASRHLALNPRLDNENMPNKEEAALQYYYQTLHYVQKAMQYSSYKTSLELLATTLIISAYEMLDNSTNDWERHLEGVFLIQRSQTIHGECGGLHSAVWWAWLCQDIWAAFREKRKTLTFWVPQKPLSSLLPHELAMRSIYITAKVISYCADVSTKENIQSRIDEGMRLCTMLDDWRRHLTIEFTPLPLGPRDRAKCFRPIWIRPAAFGVAMQFFNVSNLLLLAHEPSLGGLDEFIERQSVIKRCIDDIGGIAMTLTDNASSLMSSQALFIAGMFTQDTQTRWAIVELLDLCRDRTGWPTRSLGNELQHIWERHGPLTGSPAG